MSNNLVFVVYKPRSGSTYLADVLARHPDIGVASESSLVPNALRWAKRGDRQLIAAEDVRELLGVLAREPKFARWELDYDALVQQLQPLLPLTLSDVVLKIIEAKARQENSGCSVFLLKKGDWYAKNIGRLQELFPGSKVIALARDGRAIYASSKRARHSDTGRPFERQVWRSAVIWADVMRHFVAHQHSSHVSLVKYEDVVRNPKATFQQILDFIGLDGTVSAEQLLDSSSSGNARIVHSDYAHLHGNVGRAPRADRIDAWQEELSSQEIRQFERIAGNELNAAAYPLLSGVAGSDPLSRQVYRGAYLAGRVIARGLRRAA